MPTNIHDRLSQGQRAKPPNDITFNSTSIQIGAKKTLQEAGTAAQMGNVFFIKRPTAFSCTEWNSASHYMLFPPGTVSQETAVSLQLRDILGIFLARTMTNIAYKWKPTYGKIKQK